MQPSAQAWHPARRQAQREGMQGADHPIALTACSHLGQAFFFAAAFGAAALDASNAALSDALAADSLGAAAGALALLFAAGLASPRLAFSASIRLITLRSEEHTSELQSLMRTSYAVFCLKKNIQHHSILTHDYEPY